MFTSNAYLFPNPVYFSPRYVNINLVYICICIEPGKGKRSRKNTENCIFPPPLIAHLLPLPLSFFLSSFFLSSFHSILSSYHHYQISHSTSSLTLQPLPISSSSTFSLYPTNQPSLYSQWPRTTTRRYDMIWYAPIQWMNQGPSLLLSWTKTLAITMRKSKKNKPDHLLRTQANHYCLSHSMSTPSRAPTLAPPPLSPCSALPWERTASSSSRAALARSSRCPPPRPASTVTPRFTWSPLIFSPARSWRISLPLLTTWRFLTSFAVNSSLLVSYDLYLFFYDQAC